MGATYKLSSINPDKISNLMFPIVFCVNRTDVIPYTKGYTTLSINKILSNRLLSYNKEKRYLYVADELNSIVDSIQGPLMITDFEILFDPQYQIDVLKSFIMINRKMETIVLWPGKYEENKLKFAEPGYEDYKSYDIGDYDITCLV